MNVKFGSDNHSSIHPLILESIINANLDDEVSYSYDKYTKEAIDLIKHTFGSNIEVFFVFNGTASNILAISSFLESYQLVLCSDCSHLYNDECAAGEIFIGCKFLPIPNIDGKLTVENIKPLLKRSGDVHFGECKVISITQPTELGTVYKINEINAIAEFAHKNNMILHMDGTRLANAAVTLNADLKKITKDAGVDVLSLGGTKNGFMFGEAIIFFNTSYHKKIKFLVKQGMQLYSKNRFIAAQFIAYLKNNLWKEIAIHSNGMAKLLEEELKLIIKPIYKVESNAFFVNFPHNSFKRLKSKYYLSLADENLKIFRLMTSFNTSENDIKELVNEIKRNRSKTVK